MSSLTETENKNNNIQTNNQKRTKTKHKSKPQKKLNNTHTEKKYSKSFPTMISRPYTALTDFTSNLKGYLLHKCNVLLQKITCWTRVSRIFFRVSTLYRVGGGRTARKFRKGCTVLRGNRKITEKYCSTVPRTCPGLKAMNSEQVREGKSNTAGSPFLPRRKESTAIAWSIAHQ